MNKEIIIDGVDVSKCFIYNSHHTRTMCCSGLYCKQNEFANCHFKLYARKTAKCKKYEQALDTVSEHIRDNCNSCQGIKYGGCEKCELKRIKDIINKAKGEGNA